MVVNQEQTSDSVEDSRVGLVEVSELSHAWDEFGNPLGLGEGTASPSGDPIDYPPMESGSKMYSSRNPWRDEALVQCSTPTPENNIPG